MIVRRDADIVVVGGGFFGCYLACHAAGQGRSVILVEARHQLLQAASLVNQARVHNGYHYPRSILTGLRSQVNFERFAQEFPTAIERGFTHLYAIARQGSHVTAQQFALFCDRIGAEYAEAGTVGASLFDQDRVEASFTVKEWSFNAEALRVHMEAELQQCGVQVLRATKVQRIFRDPADGALVAALSDGSTVHARLALNCTYAELNTVADGAGVERMPLQMEVVEIVLFEPPPGLAPFGWTIMDGPFSSSLPFPARGLRSLYHVRYSPHVHWPEGEGCSRPLAVDADHLGADHRSHARHMLHDGARFVPLLRNVEPVTSVWTLRAKLTGSARTDSRPILFRAAQELPGLYHVLGGKIDNVYDVEPFLDEAIKERLG